MCLSSSLDTFISINFFSQSCGSIEATVINPSGGSGAFFETNFNASLKPQKETGFQDKRAVFSINSPHHCRCLFTHLLCKKIS